MVGGWWGVGGRYRRGWGGGPGSSLVWLWEVELLEGWFGVEVDFFGGKWVVEVLRKWCVMDVVVLVRLWL